VKRFLIAATVPLFLSACGGSGDGTTLSKMADDLISYVTTGRTVAENQRALVAGQGCDTQASLFGNGDCKVGSDAASGFAARDRRSVADQLSGASTTIYAVNAPKEDWSQPGRYASLHPYQNSADMVIVAVPPAASQLDQPKNLLGDKVDTGDSNDPSGNAKADIPGADGGMTAPVGDGASVAKTGPEHDASGQDDGVDANADSSSSVPQTMPEPAGVKKTSAQQKSALPPAPVATPVKTAAKGRIITGKDAGKDDARQASGRDALEKVTPDRVAGKAAAGKYVVLGSFTSNRRAQIALNQYAEYHPQLIPATVEGTPYLRIAVGPMDMSRANDLRLVTAKNGIKDSWIVSVVDSGE